MPTMLRMRSVRGPSSYAAGGFAVTLGDVQVIEQSSGRMVSVYQASSTPFSPTVVSASGNICTVMLRDGRSSFLEPSSGDFSTQHYVAIYEGV